MKRSTRKQISLWTILDDGVLLAKGKEAGLLDSETASTTYETQSHASETYETKENAAEVYEARKMFSPHCRIKLTKRVTK